MHFEAKGAYIARLDLTAAHLLGVTKKVRAQVEALTNAGAETDLFYPVGAKIMRNGETVRSFGSGSLWKRLNYRILFYVFVAQQLSDMDFVYIRYQGSSPFFLWMLRKIRARCPNAGIVIELPTYPYDGQAVSARDRFFRLVDRFFRHLLYRYVNYIVTFSDERRIFGIPTIRINNGVAVEDIAPVIAPTEGDTLRLVGLANLSFWHGYDRIIAGLAEYYAGGRQGREIRFDVIGTGVELPRLQNDVVRAALNGHVRFWGSQHGAALDEILQRCHMGISSIGKHRLERDTSDLKSREYCARGLPFVIGYEDRDFGNDFAFAFRVPEDDSPINIEALVAFYDALRLRYPDYSHTMREYAERHLTWRVKMVPVIDEIRRLLSSRA